MRAGKGRVCLGAVVNCLVNCVRDESYREKLAPTSPSGSNIIDAAINSAHRCTL